MPPITIACFKWRRGGGTRLPMSSSMSDYSSDHVNILHNMIWRNIKIPYRFVCVTDDPVGIDPRIETIPLWDKCKSLGGCFNRLYVFSPDMKHILGSRFACIDLDCVIVGDVTPIFTRKEDFIINSYQPFPAKRFNANQLYNGGLFIMNAGSRSQVWETFNPEESPSIIKASKNVLGTDQAWIRYILGTKEKVFGQDDGVYEARAFGRTIPENSKIMFFAGQRDPSLSRHPWVKENWRQ